MLTFSFLIVAWIVLLTIFLWDLIQHGADKIWMFLIIPASLVLTVTTYITVQSMLGYPTDSIKEGKFVVFATAVKEPDWIFYWVGYQDEDEPIAYRFPYSEKDHEKQEEVNEGLQNGQYMMGELKEEETTDEGSKSILGQIEWYIFDPTRGQSKTMQEIPPPTNILP